MNKPYEALFPVGSRVKIASSDALVEFRQTWRYHHKLEPAQMSYADRVVRVARVGYYHGGDVLYQLDGVPGTWHECCLTRPTGVPDSKLRPGRRAL